MEPVEALKILKATRILRAPRKRLATFSDTRIDYHLISSIDRPGKHCRLREGIVLAAKPSILTPDTFKERFEGFGPEAREFAQAISSIYQDVLRVVEYKFRNEARSVRLIKESSRAVSERIKADLDSRDVLHAVVVACPDAGWQLSLMKFIIEETQTSFPYHAREMEEHDMFDPAGRMERKKRYEIEDLFRKACADRSKVSELGKKLKEYGLFEQYEDKFFSLLRT